MVLTAAAAALAALIAGAQTAVLPLDVNGTPLELEVLWQGASAYVSLEAAAEPLDGKLQPLPDGTVSVCVGDLCVIARLDGTDPRFLQTDRGVYAAVGALPELLSAHFGWKADEGASDADENASESAGVPTLAPGAAPSRSIQPGDVVPEIALPNLAGELVPLSSFLGKKLVLYTWASW